MIKENSCQEDVTVVKVYTPYNRTLKCMKQTFSELKRKTDNFHNHY